MNVLIALSWPQHQHHGSVQHWFARHGENGWATCPFTQIGFVRILSNPSFSRNAVSPWEAMRILIANIEHIGHRFWPDELNIRAVDDLFSTKLQGHQQINDAYLLAMVIHKKSKLVTLDKGLGDLLPERFSQREFIELIHS
ncbi:MAG TPA: TA system VapC family ribonuclease toxin [Terriglobales bacterium]